MLYCTKGIVNNWIVTLYEKQTLTSPYYLFILTSDVGKNQVKVVLSDISTHQARYNEFVFTEGTTGTLNPTGQWTYDIYEQTSSTNTNINNTTSKLESGILKVVGTGQTYYANTGIDNTFYIHE